MAQHRPPRILIIEDENIVAIDARQVLEAEGYEVTGIARDAVSGLQFAQNQPPDVAIVDVNLVGAIDGISVARELSDRYDTKVVFATGFMDDVLRQGADIRYKLVAKPFVEQELVSAVRACLVPAP